MANFVDTVCKISNWQRALISPAKAQTLSAELTGPVSSFPLPWSAYVRLLWVKNEQARKFYETEALRGGWSVRQLNRQINSLFYERTAPSRNKAQMLSKGALAKSEDAITPEEEIKDPYVLEFFRPQGRIFRVRN